MSRPSFIDVYLDLATSWPWDQVYDSRPHDGNTPAPSKTNISERVRLLEKAGALIAAEIDRLLAMGG